MLDLARLNLSPLCKRVFEYFEEISKIPHGSGNMQKIADYCENFARKFGLQYIRDDSDNVVIFKNGINGGENAAPIILQGHLDMVCQHTENRKINFLTEGLKILFDGDFIKADGTTLGADNGIAVSYILAILESQDITHPPIEAVFTVDEEIGLLGANALDTSVLKSQKMINLDSETDDVLTVSCAGGEDVIFKIPIKTKTQSGTKISLKIKGLLGGHSGVEIDKGRINANILMGNILNYMNENTEFELISVNGGKKPNAIPDSCTAEILTQDKELFQINCQNYLEMFENKIKNAEPDFCLEIKELQTDECCCFDKCCKKSIIELLRTAPNGVIKMSQEIEGLVETSLNLGILSTENGIVKAHFALRSNKEAELHNLTEKLIAIGEKASFKARTSGFYPPWEFKADSPLRELYKKCYKEQFQKDIKVEAIHAGLECAVFSSTINNLDCISVGPNLFDVHTPNEKLSIPSTVSTFELLLKVLKESCKL